MSILPYESVGFYGEPLQLTILSVADEQDIFSPYIDHTKNVEKCFIINEQLYEKLCKVLIISIFTMMVIMIITLFFMQRDDVKKD